MSDQGTPRESFHEAEKTLRDEFTRALTTTFRERPGVSPTEIQQAEQLSRLLPEAICRSQAASDALAESLSHSVERAITISSERDRGPMVEAFTGLVGPAMRKALYERLRTLVLALNRFILFTLTWRGWKWRFEALRTGQPFREVVRRHQTTNPVKQVFLIHRETGLLLQELQSGTFEPRDGDMVSGMLTAIQDFVHDSFSMGKDGRLETIRVGDLTVWIEQGPLAILAGIMQGEFPPSLRAAFRTTLRRIHSRFDKALQAFHGDVADFLPARPYLERCLRLEAQSATERVLLLTWLVLLAPFVALGVWEHARRMECQRWRSTIQDLSAMPGIVVVEEGRRGDHYYVRGLRDPSAENPLMVLRDAGFSPGDVDSAWEPYQAVHPSLLLARANTILKPPPSVILSLSGDVLVAEGSASGEWIERAGLLACGLEAISSLNVANLVNESEDPERRWHDYITAVSRQPGIVVVGHERRDGRWHVAGLRDPLAVDPVEALRAHGFDPVSVDSAWELYQAADPQIALRRAEKILVPPEGVSLSLSDGMLVAEGVASHRWIHDAGILAKGLSGVSCFSTEMLQDRDVLELEGLKEAIEVNVFHLLIGNPDLRPGQQKRLNTMIEQLKQFGRVARRTGREYVVEVRGHTNTSGDEDTNESASATLARRFLGELKGENLDVGVFRTRGMGSVMPALPENRRVGPHDSLVSIKIVFLNVEP